MSDYNTEIKYNLSVAGMNSAVDLIESLERQLDEAKRIVDTAKEYVARSSGPNIDSYPEFLKLKSAVETTHDD